MPFFRTLYHKLGRVDLKYDMLFRRKRPRTYEFLLGITHRVYGRKIRLDASSVCQLKCPACSTASGMNKAGVVGAGHLRFENFKRLLDENPEVKLIELSNWGEIFLNPQINDIMRYAYEKGVRLMAANGVNLNTVSDETLENIVKYRFHYLSVSIDGASPETYAQYRIKGDFDTVIGNVRRINHFKKVYKSRRPELGWQFIIFGHNEHELPRARAMADELGMRLKTKLNHTPTHSPVQDEQYVRKEGGFGAASRDEYREGNKREYSFPCGQMWDNPQINWDGKLLGCCVNKFGDFGNVFDSSLKDALQGETFVYAKDMVLGFKPPREDIPCYKCKTYWRLHPDLKAIEDEKREKARIERRAEKDRIRAAKARAKDEKERRRQRKAAKLWRIRERTRSGAST